MAKQKSTPFHKLWTHRFCAQNSRPSSDQTHAWHTELVNTPTDQNWHRMVINNWAGKPFDTVHDVHVMVNWLAECAHPHVFCARRGRSHLSVGVQIWCVAPETQLLVHMMAAPVIHTHTYMPDQFASQLDLMLGWLLPT